MALSSTALLLACGDSTESTGALEYSITPGNGVLLLAVEDTRLGEHSVWIVVNDSRGVRIQDFSSFANGTSNSGEVSADMPLQAGAYHFYVYDVEGIHHSNRNELETPDHLVDEGDVEVL